MARRQVYLCYLKKDPHDPALSKETDTNCLEKVHRMMMTIADDVCNIGHRGHFPDLKVFDDADVWLYEQGRIIWDERRNEVFDAIKERAHRTIIIGQDYAYPPITQLRKCAMGKPNVCLSSFDEGPVKHKSCWSQVKHWIPYNWNENTFDPDVERVVPPEDVQAGLMYYGSVREDRIPDLQKYMRCDRYQTHALVNSKHLALFDIIDPRIKFWDRWYKLETLQNWQASIYIEDFKTHTHYHSPADRFYECLSARVPLLFDGACENTWRRSGYIDHIHHSWVVTSAEEVEYLLPKWQQILKEQESLYEVAKAKTSTYMDRFKQIVEDIAKGKYE